MKKKLFVISDVHGYYTQMKAALDAAGFEQGNDEHLLIVCGDLLDRGKEPAQVLNYLMNTPNKVLVRGNHEDLFEEACKRTFVKSHDIYNGTAESIAALGAWYIDHDEEKCCSRALKIVSPIFNSTVNYFETENYIFVHGWIPVKSLDKLPKHYTKNREFEFNPNWRKAKNKDWEQARWGNPFDMAQRKLLPDKTIVFGHWHCSTGWAQTEIRSEFGDDAKFDIFHGDGFVAIDGCTAHSGIVNCLVIEDSLLGE